jgi:hypothetical protein
MIGDRCAELPEQRMNALLLNLRRHRNHTLLLLLVASLLSLAACAGSAASRLTPAFRRRETIIIC